MKAGYSIGIVQSIRFRIKYHVTDDFRLIFNIDVCSIKVRERESARNSDQMLLIRWKKRSTPILFPFSCFLAKASTLRIITIIWKSSYSFCTTRNKYSGTEKATFSLQLNKLLFHLSGCRQWKTKCENHHFEQKYNKKKRKSYKTSMQNDEEE